MCVDGISRSVVEGATLSERRTDRCASPHGPVEERLRGHITSNSYRLASCCTVPHDIRSCPIASYRVNATVVELYRASQPVVRPCCIISPSVSRHVASYCVDSYRIVSYHTVSYRIIPYRTVLYLLYGIAPYHMVSYRKIPYNITPYHMTSYHVTPYAIFHHTPDVGINRDSQMRIFKQKARFRRYPGRSTMTRAFLTSLS